MAQPQRERYALLKIVLGVGSVAGLMLAWLGFARSSDARIEAWRFEQQAEETATAAATQPTATAEAPSTAVASTPAATATATPSAADGSFADSWPTPRARTSRGS